MQSRKYALLGYVVAKFIIPMLREQAKRAAKRKAKHAVTGTADAARRHPARTSVAVGAAMGAAGWLLSRPRGGHEDADEDVA
jgi:hypothetical protein